MLTSRPGDEPPSFHDLPLGARLLYVNFAPVSDFDEPKINDLRRPASFLGVTHGRYKTLYLLTPELPDHRVDELGPKIYLVPSGEIVASRKRREMNDKIMKYDWPPTRRYPVDLRTTERPEKYSHLWEDIIDVLRAEFEAPPSGIGVHTTSGTGVDESFFVSRRDLMSGYISVWKGEARCLNLNSKQYQHRTEEY